MKTVAYLAVFIVAATCYVNAGNIYYDLKDAPYLFHKFIRDYSRRYENTEEVVLRYSAFLNSLDRINQMNAEQPDATFDINKFADRTEEELKAMNGVIIPKGPPRPRVQNTRTYRTYY